MCKFVAPKYPVVIQLKKGLFSEVNLKLYNIIYRNYSSYIISGMAEIFTVFLIIFLIKNKQFL